MKISIKNLTQFTEAERHSWISSCNKAFKFKRGSQILTKYENQNLKCFFCLLSEGSDILASYSGFSFMYCGRKGFLSTDTFSLASHSTSLLGSHLYDFLRENDYNFVIGWPNQNIAAIRQRFLQWTFLGRKQIYFAYPKVTLGSHEQYASGPFPRSQGEFFSRKQRKWLQAIDNNTKASTASYKRLSVSMGKLNRGYIYLPIINQSKLFGYRILKDERSPEMQSLVRQLFSEADLSWIDVP